jgi:hypothetical protein
MTTRRLFLGEPRVIRHPKGSTVRPTTSYTDKGIPRAEGAFLKQVAQIKSKSRDRILTHPVTELFMHEKERVLQIAFLVPQIFRVRFTLN